MAAGHEGRVPDAVAAGWSALLDTLVHAAGAASALLVRRDGGELEVVAVAGSGPAPTPGTRWVPSPGSLCEAATTADGVDAVPDVREDPQRCADPDLGSAAIAHLGLRLRWPSGRTFGALCLHDGSPRRWTTVERGLLTVARHAIEADLAVWGRERQLQAEASARDEARRALEESRSTLRTVLDAVGGSVFVRDAAGVHLLANATYAHLLGLAPEEVVGRALHEVLDERVASIALDSDRRVIATGSPETYEQELTLEGRPAVELVRKVPLLDPDGSVRGVCGIAIDITERQEAERRLRESERALAEAQRIAHIGNWTWDIGTGRLAWSDEIFRIFGRSPQGFDPTYQRFLEHIHPDDRAVVEARVTAAVDEDLPYEVEHRVVRPDGTERIVVELGEVARDADGRAVSMIGTVQDITERRRAELEAAEARAEAERALQDALVAERSVAQRLRELERLKSTFLSGVSHELRTPVTVLDGFAEMLRSRWDELPRELADVALERIQTNAQRLADLVTRLLDLERLSRGAVELDPGDTELSAVVRATVARIEAPEHEVVVVVEPCVGHFDAGKVAQVVELLVANAVSHTPPGTRVTVRLRVETGGALLSVIDGGPGVPDDLKTEAFEPFRVGDTDRAQSRGTGVGLALVQRYAELHGGVAWIEDAPDGGAVVHVRFASIPAGVAGRGLIGSDPR